MSRSDNARLTASSVPPIWWTWVARIIGPSAPGSAREHRGGAAVAEDRGADRLGAGVLRGGAREDAAHALGPHDQAVAPGVLVQRLAAIRISGTALAQATPVMWYLSVVGSIS